MSTNRRKAANVAVWIWAISLSREFPVMLGIAALAYSLGLCIVGLFGVTWLVSYGVYRARGYDDIVAAAE